MTAVTAVATQLAVSVDALDAVPVSSRSFPTQTFWGTCLREPHLKSKEPVEEVLRTVSGHVSSEGRGHYLAARVGPARRSMTV